MHGNERERFNIMRIRLDGAGRNRQLKIYSSNPSLRQAKAGSMPKIYKLATA